MPDVGFANLLAVTQRCRAPPGGMRPTHDLTPNPEGTPHAHASTSRRPRGSHGHPSVVGLVSTPASADGSRVFVPGARLNADHTVTLPLHRGRSGNQTVWFIATEASDSEHAQTWRTSVSSKLLNARRTAAVQKVTLDPDGTVVFPATVDFSPNHVIVPGPTGFPPAAAAPGAVGNPGYTPLIQLPDGAVLNAPQIANATGRADKALVVDTARRTVRYLLTDGFARGNRVVYTSPRPPTPVPRRSRT